MWQEIIIIALLCAVVVMAHGSMGVGQTCGMQKVDNLTWMPSFGCTEALAANASAEQNESAVNETAS
jgi:hypothetical protein